MDLQLLGIRLLLAHTVLEPSLSILTHSVDDQEVCLGGRHDPLSVDAHVDCANRVAKTWQQCLGVLADFLVEPDLTVKAADGESSVQGSGNLVELGVRFVHLLLSALLFLVDTRIQCKYGPIVDSDEGALSRRLPILVPVGQSPDL